jgi:hypothetical protein
MVNAQRLPLRLEDQIDLLRRFGTNSASFLTTYPGFELFPFKGLESGGVPFVQTKGAWVGAADPLCEPNQMAKCLKEFSQGARAEGKIAVWLPVSKPTVEAAKGLGFTSVQIGSEPWFDLQDAKVKPLWSDIFESVSQLKSKGAKVVSFDPHQVEESRLQELNQVSERWLQSRKMDPLGFLNRLEPWTHAKYKRYFYVEFQGRVTAFLSAVPVLGSNSWYLVDLIREPGSNPGTTELLVISALRVFAKEGFAGASLGFAPFANLDIAANSSHPLLIRTLDFLFHHSTTGYNYSSLYQYKTKFHPSREEPLYLLVDDSKIRPNAALQVSQALFPGNLRGAIVSTINRQFKKFNLAHVLKGRLSTDLMFRDWPRTWTSFVEDTRASVSLYAILILTFFWTTQGHWVIQDFYVEHFAYSWKHLQDAWPFFAKLKFLLFPAFLHWNLAHLLINFIFLGWASFCVEILAGQSFWACAFFIPALLSNPLTDGLLKMLGRVSGEMDVGSSLGFAGCVGALSSFFKSSWVVVGVFVLGTLMYCFLNHTWLELNHLVAFGLGWSLGRIRVVSAKL